MATEGTKKNKILDFQEIRSKKKSPLIQLLKNTTMITHAIANRTCVVCNTQKSCVNKTGVCSYCFNHVLTREEQALAEEEAHHKIIRIQVIDDRWET